MNIRILFILFLIVLAIVACLYSRNVIENMEEDKWGTCSAVTGIQKSKCVELCGLDRKCMDKCPSPWTRLCGENPKPECATKQGWGTCSPNSGIQKSNCAQCCDLNMVCMNECRDLPWTRTCGKNPKPECATKQGWGIRSPVTGIQQSKCVECCDLNMVCMNECPLPWTNEERKKVI
jgi:hypothetical protein